jgi:mannose-6-phosphate isomerase-like protein (cupin superfamily)
MREAPRVVVRHSQDLHLPLALLERGDGEAEALLWPAVRSTERALHRLALAAGARTVAQRHPGSEAVYFVVSGSGVVVDEDDGTSEDLVARKVVLITPGTRYRFLARTDLLLVGGACPADQSMYDGAEAAKRRW